MAKRKVESVLDLEVNFGGVSIGATTARLGVSTTRRSISLTQADKNICGRRLIGNITARPKDDSPDQSTMDGFEGTTLSGSFDVKKIGISPDNISFGLTFNVKGLDVAMLALFAKRAGRLSVNEVQEIPDDEKNGDGEEDEDEEAE